MRTLLHLSDLHFGRVDDALVEPLIAFARSLEPDVVVVSGDLTQRARTRQFVDARRFLDRLPQPQIVVPGNHDVPLHDVFNRFLRPRRKFHSYITNDPSPVYVDDEIGVLGVDTTRSLTIKNGRVNERQIEQMRSRFRAMASPLVKIVVSHHPFDLPEPYDAADIVGRAPVAMKIFASCGVDLLLAGHLHVSYAGNTAAHNRSDDYAALVVQAGTATSTRARGESNSFNVIRVKAPCIEVERFAWQPEAQAFMPAAPERFERGSHGWRRFDATDSESRAS